MNIINEMISDVSNRQPDEGLLTEKETENENKRATKKNKKISWQSSSAIILIIGITFLSYAIWTFNNQPANKKSTHVASFEKPVFTKSDSKQIQLVKNTTNENANASTNTPAALIDTQEIKRENKVEKQKTASNMSSNADSNEESTKKNNTVNIQTTKNKKVEIASINNSPAKKASQKKPAIQKHNKTQAPKVTIAKVVKDKKTVTKAITKKPPVKTAPTKIAQKSTKKPPTSKPKTNKVAKVKTKKEKITNGKFEKQTIKFTNTLSAKKHYATALAQLNRGEIDQAKQSLEKTLSLQANHVSASKTLAGIYINEKKLDKAKAVLSAGITQAPDASELYQWLARINMEERKFKKASELLLTGSKYAKNGDYFALMALAQQNTPGFKNAITSYRQALSYKPNESKWWLGLGIVLEKTNNWKEAENAYLASLKPENLPFFLHNQANERLMYVKNQMALVQNN